MDRKIQACLYDMLQCVNEIESYFEDAISLEEQLQITMVRRAVERDLEIIGEALNRILKVNPDFIIENKREIIGTRNKIAHGYDIVSDRILIDIICNHLPGLKVEIENYLNEQ